MSDIPSDAQRSEDGFYWWDGSQWQPVDQSQTGDGSSQSTDDGSSQSTDDGSSQSTDASQASGAQIDPGEFPSIGRVLYFGQDADGYLQDLGIDTSDLQTDDPPAVA